MTQEECLQVLGLERGYTDEQLMESYRFHALACHPDRFGQNEKLRLRAEKQMQRINEAKEALNSNKYTYSKPPHTPHSSRASSQPPPTRASEPPPPPRPSPPPIPKKTPEQIAKNNKARLKIGMKTSTRTFYLLGGICWLIIIVAQKDHKESDPANPIAGFASLIVIAYWIWYASKRKKIKSDIGMK